ncbi:MAG: DUF4956 domain-containing protein [Acidimicrobiia bacterium]
MSRALTFGIDLIAIAVLALGIYFPRYRRRDMVVAFVAVNVGVLAVLVALKSAEIGSGVGLGLFGVLSIIRLRSTELDHQATGYYFASLALGFLGGVQLAPHWLSPVLSGLVLLAMYAFDHPRALAGYRHQVMVLDRAYTDETELRRHLTAVLGARIVGADVRKVDLVHDTTTVDVRYRVGDRPAGEDLGGRFDAVEAAR